MALDPLFHHVECEMTCRFCGCRVNVSILGRNLKVEHILKDNCPQFHAIVAPNMQAFPRAVKIEKMTCIYCGGEVKDSGGDILHMGHCIRFSNAMAVIGYPDTAVEDIKAHIDGKSSS